MFVERMDERLSAQFPGLLVDPPCRLTAPVILTGPPFSPSIQGYQPEYPGSIPLACPPPAVAPPTLEEESELHYASLTFHRLRPWKPQDPEGSSTTEYSEIKICK